MSVSRIAGVILSSVALVASHGYVSGAVVDGQYYGGFLVDKYSYMDDPPKVIGWSEDATDLGFVDGSSYSNADIICHKDAKAAGVSASVKAGGKVELQWTDWPESHHGPVITYLANCNGDCSSVDKTALEFFKIDEAGLINGENAPGTWASDNLISNNNSYTVTVPSSIATGNYVLRHEIIALHSAGESNGAQNYPQCLNLKVTGGGSDSPSGTVGTKLYSNTDPGIKVNIYQSLGSYTIPGPALYTGAASSGSATSTPTSAGVTAVPSSSAATDASVTPVPSPSSSSDASESSHVPGLSGSPRPSYTRRPIRSSSSSSSIPSSHPAVESALTVASAPLAQATDKATATSQPAEQTASTGPEVSVTTSPSGQSAQGSSQSQGYASTPSATASAVSSSSSASDSGSSSETSSGSPSESDTSSYNSNDWTSYLDSLSAEQFLGLLRQTMKWLVADKKHARDLVH